jgi:hypothetical protein
MRRPACNLHRNELVRLRTSRQGTYWRLQLAHGTHALVICRCTKIKLEPWKGFDLDAFSPERGWLASGAEINPESSAAGKHGPKQLGQR